MSDKSGITAAITAALAAYVEEEEAALLAAIPLRRPQVTVSLWGSSGREEMMRMRLLWQLRIVPR